MLLTTIRTILGGVLLVAPGVLAVVELYKQWVGWRKARRGRDKSQKGTPAGKRRGRKSQKGTPVVERSFEQEGSGLSRPAAEPVATDTPVDSDVSVAADRCVAVDSRPCDAHEHA